MNSKRRKDFVAWLEDRHTHAHDDESAPSDVSTNDVPMTTMGFPVVPSAVVPALNDVSYHVRETVEIVVPTLWQLAIRASSENRLTDYDALIASIIILERTALL